MGAGSSRVEAPPRRRKRIGLAGCFCGGSSSSAAASAGDVRSLVAAASSSGADEVESLRSEQMGIPAEFQASVATKDIQISGEPDQRAHPSSSTISHHLRFNNFSCHESKEDMLGTENAETSGLGRSSLKDVMPTRTFNCEVTAERISSEPIGSIEPELVELSSGTVDTNMACITEVGPSLMTPDRIVPHFEFGETGLHGTSFTTVLSSERSDTSQSSLTSEFPATSTTSSIIGESMPDVIPSAADIPILMGPQGQSGGIILNNDMASIFSSDVLGHSRETSNSETRRNNRRVMWDAFSRRGSRGYVEFDTDDLGFYSRWLDLGDDLFGDEVEETRYFHRRRHGSIRLNQYSRSRIREHRRAVFDNGNEQSTTACPLGIHQAGRCTCDSLLVAEESSARASISRIVMLTEALFEVLDEIHRQPASLSLSMVSVQAPESVVNSLPCKSYKKLDTTQCSDDMEQCHICLTEYEDGDEIRTLPCKHEFHLQCVDKWLKEVHRVCPLCRGDVCEGAS